MTPQLYDPENPIKWRDLEFEELLKLVEGRLNFHAHRHANKIAGFDKEDIRQELMFTLWSKLDKIPEDIEVFDFRFLRYVDTIFFREITNIWRSKTYENDTEAQKLAADSPEEVDPGKKKGRKRFYRDALNRSVPMIDNFDEIHEN